LILGIHPLRPMTVREVETAARPLLAEVGAVGSNLSRS
jgi:hypothetical protein